MSSFPRIRAADLRPGTIIIAYNKAFQVESCAPYGPRRVRIKMVDEENDKDRRSIVAPNDQRVSVFRIGKQCPPGVSRFFLIVDVCIEAERKRIDTVKYTKAERKWLHTILDKIEQADFMGLAAVLESKPREWGEYLGIQIHDFLTKLTLDGYILTKQQVADLP